MENDDPLGSLRERFNLSKSAVARAYGTDARGIARIEQRFQEGKIRFETVRDFLKTMGGELKIVAQFEDQNTGPGREINRIPI